MQLTRLAPTRHGVAKNPQQAVKALRLTGIGAQVQEVREVNGRSKP